MKWCRSNVRHGSRLALFALAIQLLLSFGHFHGSSAQARALVTNHPGLHDAVSFAATHFGASDGVLHEDASRPVGFRTSSDHESDGQPTDDCAICAVMALANAMVVATPAYLSGPQAFAFSYLTTDAEFVDLNSARVAFQPRAPPIS